MSIPPVKQDPPSDAPDAFSNADVTTESVAAARVLTLVFTDLADSVGLKRRLGDAVAGRIISEHIGRVRALVFAAGGREVFTAGDGFFLTFEAPSAAVEFALQLQLAHKSTPEVPRVRVGIHMGEITERLVVSAATKRLEVEGLAVDVAARIQTLAMPGQVLLSFPVFDNARQRLLTSRLQEEVAWRAHGRYRFRAIEGTLDIFEVGFTSYSPLSAPGDTEKARREDDEITSTVTGWRPGQGLEVPGRVNWFLTEKLGSGRFGEVWLAEHRKTHERRVLKFCFSSERLRVLKREVALFRVLKESLGERPDIGRVLDYQFEEAPYFLELEYAGVGNMEEWAEMHGGLHRLPLETRIEVVARVADALAAAHGVGVLHKDIKPSNILVLEANGAAIPDVRVIDFGIGSMASTAGAEAGSLNPDLLGDLLSPGELTMTSGNRLYTAPELLEGRPATVWSDIYSLGVLLYQMAAEDFGRALAAGWEREIGDELLREDIAACVDGDPAHRLTSARDLAERLRRRKQRAEQQELQSRHALLIERANRRHEHLRTGALLGTMLVLFSVIVGALQYYRAHEEEKLRRLAQATHHELILEKSRAEAAQHLAEQAQYTSAIALAAATLKDGRTIKVRDLLLNQTPERLRNIEWGLLYAGTCPETFSLDKVNAYDAAFSPDGKTFATGDRDNQTTGAGWVTVYDSQTGRRLGTVQSNDRLVWDLKYSPDGSKIVTASSDRMATVVDAKSLQVLARLKGHTAILRAAVFSPDGTQVATAARDSTIRLWDPATGREVSKFVMNGEQFCELLYCASGKSLVSTAIGGAVRLWNIRSGEASKLFGGHKDTVLSACFGADDETLITACKDGMLRVFPAAEDSGTSEVAPSKTIAVGGSFPQAVSVSRSLGVVLAACDDGKTRAYDMVSGQPAFEFQTDEPSWKLDTSPDGKRALVTSRWSIRMVDLPKFIEKTAVSLPTPGQTITTESQRVVAVGSAATRDTTWNLDQAWRVPGGRSLASRAEVKCVVDSGVALHSPDDSQRICIDDQTLSACVVRNSDNTTVAQLGIMPVCEARFSTDGKLAATIGMGHVAQLWDTGTWSLVHTLDRGTDFGCCGQFSPDGKQLVVGYADGSLVVWDCATGTQRQVFAGGGYRTLCVAFSPDAKLLASGHTSDRAKVWSVQTSDVLTTMIGHVRYVHDVQFSPDGTRLLTVSRDGTAKLWNVQNGRELLNVFDTGGKYELVTAFFCKDGKHIGAITSDKQLLLADYFPAQLAKLPGSSALPIESRLELWKRQDRIAASITEQDLSARTSTAQ
jgi:WD40 repeat protein/class 3 adenylate cyclase